MINKQLYQEVWEAMDASNSAALITFLKNDVVPAVWNEIRSKEFTKGFNNHPLIIIMADKLLQLAHCYSFDAKDYTKVSNAYEQVYSKIQE